MRLSADLRRGLVSGGLITAFSVFASVVPTYIWLQIDPVIRVPDVLLSALVLPMLIAPSCAFFIIRARLRADQLARENHRLANVDELTGLPNRRAFFAAAQGLQAAAGQNRVFVCAIADIDNFKQVNDTFGHEAGDRVLKTVGGIFRSMTPGSGIIARLGGEEFAMAGVFGDRYAAQVFCEQMVARVAAEAGLAIERQGRLTISLGFCIAAPGETVSTLLSRADHALYQAKLAGKNCALDAEVKWTPRAAAAHH